MDGKFYSNTLEPWGNPTVPSAVTLTTTIQLISPAYMMPNLGNSFFNWKGKAVRVRASGRANSGATPGNINIQFNFGPATSNTGQLLGGVNYAGAANMSNYAWFIDIWIRCHTLGASGALFGTGMFFINGGIFMISPFNPVDASVDLTASPNYVTLQVSRSGSTAESFQMFDYVAESMN